MIKYKKALSTATFAIRNLKRSYERKLSLHIKDDPRAFYMYVVVSSPHQSPPIVVVFYMYARSKTKMKDTVGPLTDDFGNVIRDDGVNAKLINEYFALISTKDNLMNIPMCNKQSYINALNTVDCTE